MVNSLMQKIAIFIGGTGRSGTTILSKYLGTHSDIYQIPFESKFITEKYGTVDLYTALTKNFNTVHFLPFYPSSSDSGFAVKDHYKIDKKYGNWGDINSFSKNNLIMADVVINHASSRGLWFKNYLKMKSPGRGYFFTINNKFNT